MTPRVGHTDPVREQDAELIALDIVQQADKTFDRAPPAPQERDAGRHASPYITGRALGPLRLSATARRRAALTPKPVGSLSRSPTGIPKFGRTCSIKLP